MSIDFGTGNDGSRYGIIADGASGLNLPDSDWAIALWIRLSNGTRGYASPSDFQYFLSCGALNGVGSLHLFFGNSSNYRQFLYRMRGASSTELNVTVATGIGDTITGIDTTDRLIVIQRRSGNIESYFVAKGATVSAPNNTTAWSTRGALTPATDWMIGNRADLAASRAYQNVLGEVSFILDGSLSAAEVEALAVGVPITDVYPGAEAHLKFLQYGADGSGAKYAPVRVTDDFERTDADPAGLPWVTAGDFGALKIESGALVGTDNSNRGAYYSASWSADQWAECVMSVVGEGGPAVRIGAGGVNAYRADYYAGEFRLAKHVENSYSSLGAWTRTVVDGDTLRIEVEGTTIRGYHNGALVGSVTDSSLTTGNAGVVIWHTARVASWAGGPLVDEADVIADHDADFTGSGIVTATHPFTYSSGPAQYEDSADADDAFAAIVAATVVFDSSAAVALSLGAAANAGVSFASDANITSTQAQSTAARATLSTTAAITNTQSLIAAALAAIDEEAAALTTPTGDSSVSAVYAEIVTGDEVLDAIAAGSAALVAAAVNGDAWVTAVEAFATIVTSADAATLWAASTDTMFNRAISDTSDTASAFVNAAASLSNLTNSASISEAMGAIVVAAVAFAAQGSAGATFAARQSDEIIGNFIAAADATGLFEVLSLMRASLNTTAFAQIVATGTAATVANYAESAVIGASFTIVTPAGGVLIIGAISLRAAIAVSQITLTTPVQVGDISLLN